MASATSVDVVILTALQKERDALLRCLEAPLEILTGTRRVHRASTPSALADSPLSIIVVCLEDMGNVKAAIATTQAVDVWNPAFIILAGIAGSPKSGTNRYLGDVVVGEQIVFYEPGKQESETLKRRYQVYRPAKPLIDSARAVSPQVWQQNVKATRPDGTTGRILPQVHFGVVASGEKVVKDSDFIAELKDDWAQLIGIEMEAAGAATAAYESGAMPGILVAKGICDWADSEKADAWQEYAASTSAAFVMALLRGLPRSCSERPEPVRRDQPCYSGRVKLKVCSRLTSDWNELADYFEISTMERARFERGREPHSTWEWLDSRRKLSALKEALEFIGRGDLVKELEG